ncbi:hypothetical protein PSP6_590065 [Paraburkholderia tropica]|nr:hypothetical protein PSP6_590065 [Paraburkholderia tropica]
MVILRPSSAATGSTHERTATPSRCTVQAPHCAMPQPNFVPVRPTISRNTQSSGMSGGASIVWVSPLMVNVVMGRLSGVGICQFLSINRRPYARVVPHAVQIARTAHGQHAKGPVEDGRSVAPTLNTC